MAIMNIGSYKGADVTVDIIGFDTFFQCDICHSKEFVAEFLKGMRPNLFLWDRAQVLRGEYPVCKLCLQELEVRQREPATPAILP